MLCNRAADVLWCTVVFVQVPGKKQNPNEKLKRKNYEIRLLQDELRSRRSDIGHHRRVTTAVETREVSNPQL